MTKLPGDRPERSRNFHDQHGQHVFPHPSAYLTRKSEWTAWDRRYAAHLDRHKELIENPERTEGDHPAVLALFDHIDHLRLIVEKELLLIKALREKFSQAGELDESDLRAVRMIERGMS